MKFFDLVTPLSEREIVERLRANVDTGWFLGDKPAQGFVSEHSFSLRRRISYRNSFQTNLRGRFIEEGIGTRIKCYAGMHPAAIAFMTIWFAFTLFGAAMSLVAMNIALNNGKSITGIIFGLALPLFGVVLVATGRYFARSELATLKEFLEKTIDARPA
jgi:uncharacterized membrane protein (DUF485 family)